MFYRVVREMLRKIRRMVFLLRYGRNLKVFGVNTWVNFPFRADGKKSISIGDYTFIQRGTWLYSCGIEGVPSNLTIGGRCVFGYNNHITAVRSVSIGDSVLTANNVYISDNVHGYEDVGTPIINQPLVFKKAVKIGSGTWLGENVCVIGASVGQNCVVGANSVVTRDIPDFCVAVGAPAKVIKQFNQQTKSWEPVSSSKKL